MRINLYVIQFKQIIWKTILFLLIIIKFSCYIMGDVNKLNMQTKMSVEKKTEKNIYVKCLKELTKKDQ